MNLPQPVLRALAALSRATYRPVIFGVNSISIYYFGAMHPWAKKRGEAEVLLMLLYLR